MSMASMATFAGESFDADKFFQPPKNLRGEGGFGGGDLRDRIAASTRSITDSQ